MSEARLTEGTDARAAAAKLVRQSPPVLVEVRFPKMGTSSDWHLLDDEDDFDALVDRLGPNVELHVSSVWDLKNPCGAIRLTK